jgi:hypothetical protein
MCRGTRRYVHRDQKICAEGPKDMCRGTRRYVQRYQKTKKYRDSLEFRWSVPHKSSRRGSLHTVNKLIKGKKKMCRAIRFTLIRESKSRFRCTVQNTFQATKLTLFSPHLLIPNSGDTRHIPHFWQPQEGTKIEF